MNGDIFQEIESEEREPPIPVLDIGVMQKSVHKFGAMERGFNPLQQASMPQTGTETRMGLGPKEKRPIPPIRIV